MPCLPVLALLPSPTTDFQILCRQHGIRSGSMRENPKSLIATGSPETTRDTTRGAVTNRERSVSSVTVGLRVVGDILRIAERRQHHVLYSFSHADTAAAVWLVSKSTPRIYLGLGPENWKIGELVE